MGRLTWYGSFIPYGYPGLVPLRSILGAELGPVPCCTDFRAQGNWSRFRSP